MQNLNILIIGAGVAGLTCAGLLKKQGAKFKIVEKENSTTNPVIETPKDSTTTIKPIAKVKATESAPVEYIKMSPAEFESLIDKVLETNKTNENNALENEKLKKRVEVLEKAMLEKNKPTIKKQ